MPFPVTDGGTFSVPLRTRRSYASRHLGKQMHARYAPTGRRSLG